MGPVPPVHYDSKLTFEHTFLIVMPFQTNLNRISKSIYHWGYWGSFTEPPCSPYVHWRVLSEATYISRAQWDQMRNILFTNVDENCKHTSTADTFGAARPTQPFRNRDLHKCRSSDYVSDKEKQRMREETGNPHWCC